MKKRIRLRGLWALYDSQGNPMPLMARSFSTPGKARQLAWKTTMLAEKWSCPYADYLWCDDA